MIAHGQRQLKEGDMKRFIGFSVCMFLLLGCSKPYMVTPERPDIVIDRQKATLVIIRDSLYRRAGESTIFANYIDCKFIGDTLGKSYIVAKVEPGPHHVICITENFGVAFFDFQPGTVYFLNQRVMIGVFRERTAGYFPMTYDEAMLSISGCEYRKYDPTTNFPDMAEVDYKQAVSDYAGGVRDYPDGYKALLEYEGYKP